MRNHDRPLGFDEPHEYGVRRQSEATTALSSVSRVPQLPRVHKRAKAVSTLRFATALHMIAS
jgi:hypothetical protein